jgi:uncharacterized protein with von Willebrand factor type A (vWA) domain
MEHVGFFYKLRDYGVPVSMKYVLEFHEALNRGLGGDLDQVYTLLRLICIKRLEHIDPFERAFAKYYLDIDIPPPGEPVDMEGLLESKPFREWLDVYLKEKGMKLNQVLWEESAEELLKKFLETIAAQTGAHHGGGKWIGTGGYSPWGHSGYSERGFRIGGASRNRSAIKVLGDRRYANYSVKSELKKENIRQVLGSLKRLTPAGPKTELDLDETIRLTAKNAGEIELAFMPEIRDKIKVLLLIDNGGYSMDRYVPLVRIVFSKMYDRFKDIKTYFFHNCIYHNVYTDSMRTRPFPTEKLMQESRNTRVFVIGDAAMAPEELLLVGGSISWRNYNDMPGYSWLKKIRGHFPYSVWLNPIPKDDWDYAWGAFTIGKVRDVFHMEEMTLEGMKNSVEYLSQQKAYKPY